MGSAPPTRVNMPIGTETVHKPPPCATGAPEMPTAYRLWHGYIENARQGISVRRLSDIEYYFNHHPAGWHWLIYGADS